MKIKKQTAHNQGKTLTHDTPTHKKQTTQHNK